MTSRDATFEPLGDELFKLTLSEGNKAEIFDYGLSKLDQSQQEAYAVLHNLAKWDKRTRSLFALRSTSTILDTPFRLIYPISDLPSFEETGLYVRQYMAVSYCWRSGDFLPHSYQRHGQWPVSKPFVDAILGEKNHPRVGIWMDQLCIDQESSIDKQKSVAAMDIVYRSCLRVLVLLEDVFLEEAEISLMKKYDPSKLTVYDPEWRPPMEEHTLLNSIALKVTAARWWQRAWCFHEFNVMEPWSEKRKANEIHNATFILNGPAGSTVKIKWWTLYHVVGMAPGKGTGEDIFYPLDTGYRELNWRSSIMARHNGVSSKGCLLQQDKLSIMINLCGLGLAYQGESLNEDEVFYISALLSLAGGETYSLTTFGGRNAPKLLGKASWLQRQWGPEVVSIPNFQSASMNGIYRVSMHSIELDVLFLPNPGQWFEVMESSIKHTYDIFPNTIATTPIATYGPVEESLTTPNRSDTDLDTSRRKFLAICVENGPMFTNRLWAQLKKDAVEANFNQFSGLFKPLTANPSLYPAARIFYAKLFPVSALLGIPPSSKFTLHDAHLFLTWLTDPRSVYHVGVLTWRIPCTLDGREALSTHTLVNENFMAGPVDELRAAVPIDLLDVSCEVLRIWLLRPSDREGVQGWRIVGKAVLLGEPDLRGEVRKGNDSAYAAVKFQRVHVSS